MMRNIKLISDFVKTRPYVIIEGIGAISIFIFGLFLISPLYAGVTNTAGAVILASNIGKTIFLASCMIPPILTIVGSVRKPFDEWSWKLRAWGSLGAFYGYLFTTILWILVAGLIPTIWIFTFALSLIAAVVYLRIKWELAHR